MLDVKLTGKLAQNIAHARVAQKSPQLVADRSHCLQTVTFGPTRELTVPKVACHRILGLLNYMAAVVLISEHAVDIKQSRVSGIKAKPRHGILATSGNLS